MSISIGRVSEPRYPLRICLPCQRGLERLDPTRSDSSRRWLWPRSPLCGSETRTGPRASTISPTKPEYYASRDEQGTLFNEWFSPVSQCGFNWGCRTADEAVNSLEPERESAAALSSEVAEAWQKRSLWNHASPRL